MKQTSTFNILSFLDAFGQESFFTSCMATDPLHVNYGGRETHTHFVNFECNAFGQETSNHLGLKAGDRVIRDLNLFISRLFHLNGVKEHRSAFKHAIIPIRHTGTLYQYDILVHYTNTTYWYIITHIGCIIINLLSAVQIVSKRFVFLEIS